ncbi:MAG: hypothetical protein WBQ34_10150 [Candidatus Acidiferrales bacterium]
MFKRILLAIALVLGLAANANATPSVDGSAIYASNGTSATSAVVSVPSGAVVGDCLVTALNVNEPGSSYTITPPSGATWTNVSGTILTSAMGGRASQRIDYRQYQAGDTSWTWTNFGNGTATSYFIIIQSLNGVSCTPDGIATPDDPNTSGTAPSTGTLTNSTANDLMLTFWGLNVSQGSEGGAKAWTGPTGFTLIQNDLTTNTGEPGSSGGGAYYKLVSGSGSFGPFSATLGVGALWTGFAVSFPPGAAPTPTPTATATPTATPTPSGSLMY